jgi:hypothetical protein
MEIGPPEDVRPYRYRARFIAPEVYGADSYEGPRTEGIVLEQGCSSELLIKPSGCCLKSLEGASNLAFQGAEAALCGPLRPRYTSQTPLVALLNPLFGQL